MAAPDPKVEPVQNLHLAVPGNEIVDAQDGLRTSQRVELLDRHNARNGAGLACHLVDRNDAIDAAEITAAGTGARLFRGRHQCAPR